MYVVKIPSFPPKKIRQQKINTPPPVFLVLKKEVPFFFLQKKYTCHQVPSLDPYLDVTGSELGSMVIGSVGDFTPRNTPFITR